MKNRLAKVFVCFGLLSISCGPFALAATQDETKIATVDMQRAIQAVDLGKKAKAQLEKEFNQKKKELQAEESTIRKASEDFKKQSMVMSDDARSKKQAELQEKFMKFQELTQRSQMDIQQKEKDLTMPIVTKIKGVIAKLAEEKKISVVLEKNENNVLFFKGDDLTEQVITNFDKTFKDGGNS